MKVRKSREDRIFYAFSYAFVILLTVIVLYPLILIVSCSFSSPNAVSTGKVIFLPVDLSVVGYATVFQNPNVWIGYKNTLIYTVLGTLVNVSMTLICAYPLAGKNSRTRAFLPSLSHSPCFSMEV